MKKNLLLTLLLLTINFFAFSQDILFEDDFENGASNWVLTGTWGLTDQQSSSPTHSMTDSPSGNYAANLNTFCTMASSVDLSTTGILSATVSFNAIYDIETSIDFDWLRIYASIDDFATQSEIAIFNGEDHLTPWTEYEYSLGAFIGYENVKVRFHFHSDAGYEVDGFYFDDFKISTSDVDDSPPYIGYDNPPTFYEGTMYDFTFNANIIDVSGIENAFVYYSVDGSEQDPISGVNTSGDVFQFTIPAQVPGSMVEFSLSATDASGASNTISTDTYKYISGHYIYYDDPEVAFYTNMLAGSGAAVWFSLPSTTQLVAGLIRNYEDQSNPPNKNFMFHVWGNDNGFPGEDLITPFEVVPAATPTNPSPMTVIDLREYMEILTVGPAEIFIGLTIPEDTVKITMATINASRSFTYDGITWNQAAYDFHFRLITNGNSVGVDEGVAQKENNPIYFPNPSSDILYIESKSDILSLQVISSGGQVVKETQPNVTKTQIDTKILTAGVYFINVKTINGISTQKIIVN